MQMTLEIFSELLSRSKADIFVLHLSLGLQFV